jgi:hypothetical protein
VSIQVQWYILHICMHLVSTERIKQVFIHSLILVVDGLQMVMGSREDMLHTMAVRGCARKKNACTVVVLAFPGCQLPCECVIMIPYQVQFGKNGSLMQVAHRLMAASQCSTLRIEIGQGSINGAPPCVFTRSPWPCHLTHAWDAFVWRCYRALVSPIETFCVCDMYS